MHKNILIITYHHYNQGYNSPVQRLKRIRENLNYQVFVHDIHELLSPDSILEIIKNYYHQHSIYYLIIIGSIEEIPSYIRDIVDDEWKTALNHQYTKACSDISYGIYVNNKNIRTLNNSVIKIIVGRITPGDNIYLHNQITAELTTTEKIHNVTIQIDKIEYYENLYDSIEYDFWFKNVVGIASSEGDGIGIENMSDKIYMRKELEKLVNSGFNCHEIYEGNTTEQHNAKDIGTLHVDQDGVTKAQLINKINSGLGMLFYTGHAYENRFYTSELNVTDLIHLNKNNNLFFGNVVGCSAGSHDESYLSLAEAFQILPNAGSIAFTASTIMQAWEEPMYMQREIIDIIINQLQESNKLTLGEIYKQGMLNSTFLESYNHDFWFYTFFGDPSTRCLMTKNFSFSILDVIKYLHFNEKKNNYLETISNIANFIIYL